MSSITASLQDVFGNFDSVKLSGLSNSVNSAFKSITPTCHKLNSEASGIVGSVDVALGGVNLALSHLIDTILTLKSATVRQLSSAIDNAIKKIIKTLAGLVRAVKGVIKSIARVTSIVYSALQAIIKTSIIIVLKSFNTVRTSLVENESFVTPLLSTVLKTVSEEVEDLDVNIPIDIEKIINELSKCSEGTVIDLECTSSALDGSSNRVDIEVSAISTCPHSNGELGVHLDELKSSTSRAFDEIIYTIECAIESLLDWNDTISPAIMKNLFAIQDLIDAALSASGGNAETLEQAIVNIALGVQSILHALDSITSMAKKEPSEHRSSALKLIQHGCYTVISIDYNIFFAISVPIDGLVSPSSILSPLTATLEVAIDGSPSELLEIRQAIDYICVK